MDIGRAFTYATDDNNWITKVLLGGIISLIPIINLAVPGYFLEIIRNVSQKQETPLPEWGDFGSMWVRGLLFSIILFIYNLPAILIAGFGIIPIVLSALAQHQGDVITAVAGGMFFFFLAGLWFILIALITPGIAIAYAITGSFGEAFSVGKIISLITNNIGDYMLAILIVIVCVVLIGIIATIPVLGWIASIFVSFYTTLVIGYTYGQLGQG